MLFLATIPFGVKGQYCIPSHPSGCTSGDDIDSFTLTGGGINHLGTGCSAGAYGDFTALAAQTGNLTVGQTYNFNITHGFSGQFVKIWIDFNNNDSFEDAGELLYSSAAGAGATAGTIAIPLTATPTTTRLRVMTRWNSSPTNSCDPGGGWGETHDYTVNIVVPLPYTINAPANNATGVLPTLSQLQITMNNGTATAGTGFLRIFRVSDNVEVAAINVASATIVGGAVTFPNSTVLECNTQYYVLIDNGAIDNGGSFTGITSNTAWRFTTGAAPTSALVSSYGFQAISGGAGAYVQIVGGNTMTTIQTDDQITTAQPIGFTFFYENVPFTQFRASSNGFISFNPLLSNFFAFNDLASNPVGGQRRPFIAPLWDDLSGAGGTALYQTTGTAPNRVCTIEFRNWRWQYGATAAGISFQVKLYETTNVIEFIYRQQAGALSAPTASIGLGSGTNSVYLSLNNSGTSPTASSTVNTTNISTKPATGQIYRFTPGPVGASIIALSPADNSTGINPTTNLSITYNYPMQVGTGNITIHRVSDNSVVETIDVTSGQVVVNGNVITIDPSVTLPLDTDLYVNMPAGAFQSCNSVPSAAVSGNSTWNFRTLTPDADSQVETPATQVVAGNMNIGSTKNVLNIGIEDVGTTDGLPTVITGVTVNLSGGSILDLTSALTGAQLRLNATNIASTATINAGSIVFTIPAGNLSVADASTATLSVFVTGLNDNTLDGLNFSLDVAAVHGFTTDAFSSGLLANTVGAVSGNLQTFVISTGGGGVQPPGTPLNFTAVAQGTNSILLTWGAAFGATSYNLYATAIPGGVESLIFSGNALTYLHTDLVADGRYTYRLQATNSGGGSSSVYANEYTYPEIPEVTILDNACMNGSGQIRAQGTHVSGKFRWYVSETATMPIMNGSIPYGDAVYTTPALSDATVFYVSAFGQKYESARVPAPITIKPTPNAVLLGESVRLSCESSVVLEAEAVQNAVYNWFLNDRYLTTTNLPSLGATSTGLYRVEVSLNGCTALSNAVQVRTNYKPTALIEEGTTAVFCEMGSLSAREVAGGSYEWLLNDAVVGTERTLSVSASGAYRVRVTQNGCVNESQAIQVTLNTFPENITLQISDNNICEGETALLTASASNANIRYEWVKDGRVFRITSSNTLEVTESGNYSVRLSYLTSATCNKTSASSVNLVNNPTPTARLRQEGTELALRLQAPASSITWFFEGTEQPSFANQERITPTQSGSYKALVTYQSGCSIESNGERYVMITTGEEETPIAGFAIYPNPAREVLFVRLGEAFQNGQAQVQLIDVTGRSLYNQTVGTESFQIPMADLALGSYILQIQVGETLIVRQIVKE